MFAKMKAALRHYLSEQSGIAIVVFAFMLPAIMASGGIAVDLATAYNAKNRLSNALDKATLAAASTTGTEEEIKKRMEAFFHANYPTEGLGTPLNVKLEINGSVMTASADVDVPTTFMAIFGEETLRVSEVSEVVRELAGIETVLALDVTGSMEGNNIAALKTASTNFLTTMFGKVKDPNYLRIGIVPWSNAVNVGSYGKGLKPDGTYYGASFVDNPTSDSYVTPASDIKYGTGEYDWGGCILERDAATALLDSAVPPNYKMYRYPSGSCKKYNCTAYDCAKYNCLTYKCSTYDCTTYNCTAYNCAKYTCTKCNTGSVQNGVCKTKGATCTQYSNTCLTQGSCKTYGNTCLQYGNTCKTYSNTCQTYGNTCVQQGTSCISYGNTCVDWASSPNNNCPSVAIMPLSSDHAKLQGLIDALPTEGNTYSNIGMAWAWRVISPEYPYSEGAAYGDLKWSKTVILMTDGDNTINTVLSGEGTYGASGTSTTVTQQNTKFATICENMKKKGIRIYTVTFQSAINSTTKDYYRKCATNPDMYFDAPTNQKLLDAFQNIANQLSQLHITK